MNSKQAWQATLGQLQMDMSKAAFDTWVRSTELVSYEEDVFTIGVQNAYARDWLENRLTSTINHVLSGLMNKSQTVKFIVWLKEADAFENASSQTERSENQPTIRINKTINPKYTFSTFVVGPSNRLAHAASLAVSENPAEAYNPFFLYGGVGMGKTHLLHAIGNAIMQQDQEVLYVSSEDFTNDLINSIRSHNTPSFRDRYRNIDVLLIDDIQFIAGKESTQEEFFHTFNTLHGQNKQIVMSSDRPPKAMVTLEERLRSRFEWGLTADIQPPDFETRLAILRSKADRANRNVPAEIMEIIARKIQSNIRELEGALTRVLAFTDLSGRPLTTDLVNTALADMIPKRNTVDSHTIINAVSESFGVTTDKLFGRDRSRSIALPRQIAMYLMREEANFSLPQIGQEMGGRDHTTVMYACEKVSDMLERDDRFRRQVMQIRENLYSQTPALI